MSSGRRIVQLHKSDDVAVAIEDLAPGEVIEPYGFSVRNPVPRGHKIATRNVRNGDPVRKFSQVIGLATRSIERGEHIHNHNIMMMADADRTGIGVDRTQTIMLPEDERRTFLGFKRAGGRYGTRNYVGIVTSVNCSASVAKMIARAVESSGVTKAFPNVDGVVAITHGTGCGMSGNGIGIDMLRRTLRGYMAQPNFGGVLVLGLGCEVNQVERLLESGGLEIPSAPAFNIQDVGGTDAAVSEGVRRVTQLLELADQAIREPTPAAGLSLALQCGGSDGFSGITANPALGVAADLLVKNGGTVILSETPEIYGAEHLLLRRAASEEVGRKLLERLRWWEEYARAAGAELDNNPTPGNKMGGLTTIVEKSLGAAAKGGTTNLVDVLQYGEPLGKSGFVFMDSPGYDPCAVTGQIASGANLVCFTTGRGSVSGYKPVPCLKLATNTPMYQRLQGDMDFNCGTIVSGGADIDEVGRLIFDLLLKTASGEKTKSESLGFGDCEFVPWQVGAVL